MKTREMYFKTDFEVRKQTEDGKRYIEGYFIRFNETTELTRGMYEKVLPEAVEKSIKNNDIRCLFNHDSAIVLGRTSNKTLELRTDSRGVYGKVEINPNDKQAMDILARIERGDINACSFGFNIIDEVAETRSDGSVEFVLKDVDLIEVSPVTFPAYPTTSINAREKDIEKLKSRSLEVRKSNLKARLNKNGN